MRLEVMEMAGEVGRVKRTGRLLHGRVQAEGNDTWKLRMPQYPERW